MGLSRLRERKEWKFFGVLPKADRPLAVAWWVVLVLRGVLPGGVRHRDGRARRRGAARRPPRRPARLRRRRLRPAPGADADPSGGQRQPRRPHRGLALRPADRGLRAPAGHGPPRGSDADQRPHRRARLRPRHDRPAAVDLDGLHRRRPGRDDRRPRVARSCCSPTRGGRRSCSAAPGWRRTGCCARARSGATATPTRCAPRSATPTTPTGWPSIRRPAKELRLFGLAGWTIDRFVDAPHAPARAAVRRRPGCASSRCSGACCSSSPPTSSCSGRSPSAAAGGRLSLGAGRRLRAERGRHVDDRVRRAQLGARRRRGAGRRGAAARAGDGARRRAAVRARGRPPACRRARSASAIVTFAYPGRRRRCSTASTSRSPPARRSPSSGRTAPARPRSPSCCAGSTTRSPARSRSTASTCASSTSRRGASRVTAVFQDFIRFELPLRDNVAPAGAPDDVDPRGARVGGRGQPRRARHGPGARLRRRHRSLRRPVAARRAGARAVRRAARRRRRAARRADRAARRARRSGDLRAHPRRDAALHDDPDLAPLLDRAPRRPHLRARARPGRRARHARRADGARRPLPHDVRPAGAALQRRARTRRGRRYDVLA